MTQMILAGAISFLVSIFLTPVLIRKFSAEGIGQEIREEGLASHFKKRGTPTMGGIAMLLALTLGYVITAIIGEFTGKGGFSASGVLVLALTLGLGALGFADDFIKLYKGRNLGLNKKAKIFGQLGVSLVFGVAILAFPNADGLTPASTHLSFLRDFDTIDIALGGGIVGLMVFLLFISFVIAAWSNGVNLTDGLDGLAAGVTTIVLGAYATISFWQFRNSCSNAAVPGCYDVRDPLDIAVLAVAGLGACMGFLWWNAAPAKIFMGDTGSLALGGLVAGISIASRTELLMIIVASLFVMEAASVVIQVAGYKAKKIRIFRMAPFHHHFEAGGWAETTVVIRFWLIAAVSALLGTALFYAEWLSYGGM